MSKARIMGAGLAGSTIVDANVNGNQGGGNKKQGLPGISNMRSSLVFSINQRAYGTPDSRNKVFYINQLSRIGPKSTMFSSTADGVKREPYIPLVDVMNWTITNLSKIYGEDYYLLLAGNSETLVGDLSSVHSSLSDLPNDLFIKLEPGEPLYEALPANLKYGIQITHRFISNEDVIWNQYDENDVVDCGNHLLTLVHKSNKNWLQTLNDNDFGTISMKHQSYFANISTQFLNVYRHHGGFVSKIKHSSHTVTKTVTDPNKQVDDLKNVGDAVANTGSEVGDSLNNSGVTGAAIDVGEVGALVGLTALTDGEDAEVGDVAFDTLDSANTGTGAANMQLGDAAQSLASVSDGAPYPNSVVDGLNAVGDGMRTAEDAKNIYTPTTDNPNTVYSTIFSPSNSNLANDSQNTIYNVKNMVK